MKLELQAELFRRYPKFFRKLGTRFVAHLQIDMTPFDERGIECGDGWFALVDRLSRACENEIEMLGAQGVPNEGLPRIAQIKEKFGGLRFYVNGPLSEELRVQILLAEHEISLCICERCGAPGKLREGRWRRTYCDNCDAEGEPTAERCRC